MGKKKRLNRFISRWIKSDLPEESSTSVLLLGVTRIPTSPTPARRPCSLALAPTHHHPHHHHHLQQRNGTNARHLVRPASAALPPRPHSITPAGEDRTPTNDPHVDAGGADVDGSSKTSTVTAATTPPPTSSSMDRSVDSIGTCSLDVDASAELLSDCCENPSVDTLHSASLKSPTTPLQHSPDQHRLPSYLSLACTVNGYSQITNYDPVRLAKSRDSSPHRPLPIDNDHLTYAIQNNLLSPPNLVPLPPHTQFHTASTGAHSAATTSSMTERTTTMTTHHEFYAKKMTFIAQDACKYSYIADTVDACAFRKKDVVNGTSVVAGGGETKSFIQQRVERLYGPGALAQGFLVMKRQKSRSSESDALDVLPTSRQSNGTGDKHSKSMSDKLLLDDDADTSMKQSASSPSLPVLRHLTPEFRAQLPTFSPRRGADTIMQKSTTLPQLKTTPSTVNGHAAIGVEGGHLLNGQSHKENVVDTPLEIPTVKPVPVATNDEKNGHYFLKILENETHRLLGLAAKAEAELEAGDGVLSENAKGFLRSAAGKARLLVSQKMQQFKGLCTNNLNQAEGEAFPTTNEDLQGFWDMVMLQVDQVDSLFKELDAMRANNWQEVIKQRSDAVDGGRGMAKSRTKLSIGQAAMMRAKSAGTEEARAKREAQRKQMLDERRRAMREARSKCSVENIEIYVPEASS